MALSVITGQALAAWLCFGFGAGLIVIGAWYGLAAYSTKDDQKAKADAQIASARSKVEALADQAVTNAKTAGVDEVAAKAATSKKADAESVLDDLSSILSDFPANLRFPVLLTMLGGLIMSVATIQFGGHPIF